ncbi:WecB/TagA/CpsF family glycosyltransferase [Rhodococcoides kroppenstedtii]|uniref:WecB/TagA/CpsF family glycosyltransferase n=1 Tax=Rhodococcoides kroppenstedtii TaxID=293050 RepID=UPI0027DFCFEE|nr:WecB/TagA/CpsF family glycosyltransferase [Rhodococcus kroppenstedtii]
MNNSAIVADGRPATPLVPVSVPLGPTAPLDLTVPVDPTAPLDPTGPGSTRSAPERTARMDIAGTRVDLCGTPHVISVVAERLSGGKPLAIGSVNLDHIHHFGGIERSRVNLPTERPTHEWLLLADGQPIVDRAQDLTGTKWPRLTGADLLPKLLELARAQRKSVGFLGGTPRVHEHLRTALARDYPGLEVSGYWAPDRSTVEDDRLADDIADQVRAARTDVLVVGLGKPVQEIWIERFGDDTGARVFLAFGAAADFLSGDVSRAPALMSEHGLEWLYRLVHEPRRLFRRYLVQGPEAWLRLRGAYLVSDSDPSAGRPVGDDAVTHRVDRG